MPFDFFNSGYLAFGDKITMAFRSLADRLDSANTNIEVIQSQLDYYNQYIGKNYRVGMPLSASKPVRTKEIFDALEISRILLREVKWDSDSNKFKIALNSISERNIITCATGESSFVNGICYIKLASTNTSPSQEVIILDADDDSATKPTGRVYELLRYKYNATTQKLDICNINTDLPIQITYYDDHYKSISLVDVTSVMNDVEENDCGMYVVTTNNNFQIKDIDGNVYTLGKSNSTNSMLMGIPVYLTKGEKVFNGVTNIYRVDVNNDRSA